MNSSLPCAPETWTDNYFNVANKDFQLHRWSEKANYYSTSIYKNEVFISNIQDGYGIITLNLSEPGEYKAVSQASNAFGASNFSECYFCIYNSIPDKPSLSSNKIIYNVGEDRLMSYVGRVIHDSDTESLIARYLKAGVMNKGKYEPTEIGTPQGGNLSPLLSNIMLNELDKELESRGL